MSWQTHPVVLSLRDAGRALGVNSWIAARLGGGRYESAYESALSEAIRPGDVVWDVGANVGYYTKRFAEMVGARGHVAAFEPSAVNFSRLKEVCGALPNVSLHAVALGDMWGTVTLSQGADDLGATSRITSCADDGPRVGMRTGRDLIRRDAVRAPNVIKVDVEGHEPEVIDGFGDFLDDRRLRAVGIEVHFRILRERGLPRAPRQLEERLQRAGLSLEWQDGNHLLARRRE